MKNNPSSNGTDRDSANIFTALDKSANKNAAYAKANGTQMNNSQQMIRLVVAAVLSFTLAIALPFIAPRALFPNSMMLSEASAPVVVDGRVVFRVADTASTASARARARTISEGLQQFAQKKRQPVIEVVTPNESEADTIATVWLGHPNIVRAGEDERETEATLEGETQEALEEESLQFNFTVTASDATDASGPSDQARQWASKLRSAYEEAQRQRTSSYIRKNLWQIPIVPLVAVFAHWLAGILWRNYLAQLMRSATNGESPPVKGSAGSAARVREQFTTVNLFLNATLLLLRLGIWIGALLYTTNLFPDTRQISYRTISQLNEYFTKDTVPLGDNPISILDIFRVLTLLLLVTIIARIVSNVLKRRVLQETGINRGVQEAISIIIRYGLIVVGCIVVLQASGINLSSLTLLASALGVGAGLGLQNIVKDVGSGLVLVFERPVQVGEFVQIDEQSGSIERIGTRSVEIRTLDQVSIIVPNSQFLESKVVNWSHRNPISRICIPVGVSYKSDPEQVRDLLLKVGRQHSDVLATPPAIVLFKEFGDSALLFDLLVWIAQPSRQFIIKSDLMFMISKALRKENIEIPFPQRDVHIIKDLTPEN